MVESMTGLGLNLVEREGEREVLRPLCACSPRGTSRLDDLACDLGATAVYDFAGDVTDRWEAAVDCLAVGCDASATSSPSRSSRTTEGCLCRKPIARGELGLSLEGE